MEKYRLLSGLYKCFDGTTYKKGDTVESVRDLCATFKNKFELVEDHTPVQVETEKVADNILHTPSPTDGEENVKTSPSNIVTKHQITEIKEEVDVTDDFPLAVKIGGLKVIKITCADGDKIYNVVDSGNGQLHNSKPIKNVIRVKKFLKNLAEDDVEEE